MRKVDNTGSGGEGGTSPDLSTKVNVTNPYSNGGVRNHNADTAFPNNIENTTEQDISGNNNHIGPLAPHNYIRGDNNNILKGDNSVIGNNNQINSGGSDFVEGNDNQVNKSNSRLYGNGHQSNAANDIIFGRKFQSNTDDTFAVAFNETVSTDAEFQISKGQAPKFGALKGLGSQPIGIDNDGKLVVYKQRKEISFNFTGNVPQFTDIPTTENSFLDKDYKLKRIITVFKQFSMDVPKTIPIVIVREDINASGVPSGLTVFTKNCSETLTSLISNKVFLVDVDIAISANQILACQTGEFIAGAQLLKDCKVTLILEEV